MNPTSADTATAGNSPLGKASPYINQYDASLLYPIARAGKRSQIGITGALPFMGGDCWTAYELSWLGPRGKPEVAIAHVVVPCESSHIVESKSFKLYLNSFNNTRFDSSEAVQATLVADLNRAIWNGQTVQAGVSVQVLLPPVFDQLPIHELDGLNLDRLDLDCDIYQPQPDYLQATFDEMPVSETLTSRLLKSNCLVTGQPDWGSVQIRYTGPQIDQAGLLRYLVSFRDHNEFHEQCVERIFMDITRHCKPTQLTVYARYTRRGGLDINPIRSSGPFALPPNIRTARQ
jgi:7-cyano-7-deazaguanine reductase